ncbi:hypothetical protein ACIA48_07890 [Mycobacterium sp. NPDC051804]|uniref:hypothetical protein n=1 Tax=Mycobacterium sp. NPDC051804 TaxID=3364295 RepID=UPI00378B673A
MSTAIQNSVTSTVTDRHVTAAKKTTPGKLQAITASGPIYAVPATYTMIPLSSAMALYGELAAKVVNPRAKVVSSLAARVEGKTAYKAWAQQTSAFALSITRLSPAQRVAVLHEILNYVRHRGVDGNETVLAAAINGAWPYLRPEVLEWSLRYAKSAIARSTFTDRVPVAVVDPTTRAVAILEPGELKNQDPLEWLAFHRLKIDEWRLWFPNQGVDVPGLGSIEDAEGWFKDSGLGGPDPFNDPSFNGTHGLPNGRGPKGQGNGTNGFDFGLGHGPLDDPSLTGLYGDLPGRGPKGQRNGTNGFDFGLGHGPLDDPSLTGLYGDLPGGARGGRSSGGGLLDRLGANGIGSPGGPLGFGSSLGPNGGASPDRDEQKETGGALAVGGLIAGGLGGMVAAGSAMGTGSVIVGGVALAGFGAGLVIAGAVIVAVAVIANEMDKDHTSTRPGDGNAQPKEQKPAPAEQPKPAEPKPKEDPTQPVAEKDKYNDPFGKGKSLPSGDGEGGGDPTTIWDGDGGVGPTTIWEGDGGVGPASIWDENGGGGNPTTVGVRVTGTTAVGPGLRAAVMQVGPNLFVY